MAGGPESLRDDPRVALQLTPHRRLAEEWALVLISQGLSPRVRKTAEGWVVGVPLEEAGPAAAALAAYLNENPIAPDSDAFRERAPIRARYDGTNTALLISTGMLGFFLLTGPRNAAVWWFERGSADAQLILGGEIWRTVTALTLHADLQHVLANAIMGGLLVGALCGLLGSGVACLLVLVAGASGNFANAILQSAAHSSVGASTAVFGALGLLAAVSMVSRHRTGVRGRYVWLPVAAGLGVLAMLGVGGERVDLWAHLLGFVSGSMIGGAHAAFAQRDPSPLVQRQLVALSLTTIVGCWVLALP